MKDGNDLVKVGTVYASMGQTDKAVELIEKGIAKGDLKRPDDAKLRLALALAQSPKTRAKGLQMLRSVGGSGRHGRRGEALRGGGAAAELRRAGCRAGGCLESPPCPPPCPTSSTTSVAASSPSTPAFMRPRFDAAYLVVHNGRAAFIDTGTNHAVPRLLAALDALGLARDAVDYVIPTHVHLDHAGGAGLLMSHLPCATMVVHPRGARHMIDPTALYAGRAGGLRRRRDGALVRQPGRRRRGARARSATTAWTWCSAASACCT